MESKVLDLEALAAKNQRKFESIDKSLAETQDMVRRLHRVEEDKAQDLEKKIDDLKKTVDEGFDEIRTTMRLTNLDSQTRVKNVHGQIDLLYDKLEQLNARINSALSAKTGNLGKPSPTVATTSSTKTDDPFEGKGNDYSPKVKKLIQDALNTLDRSDDEHR